ncbi:MAG TPA: Uma2 family endonuclease, partial [Candidatus Limnocylindrales bacterium]|nr:Uma2 family endonuclease [Candidatus Limnocylindrales bacterium]
VISPVVLGSSWVDVKRLELVAEVLSPSHTRGDRVDKRLTYQRHQVATYWVVDDVAQLVEVWHPADERPAIVTEVLSWSFREGDVELRIALAELFAP